MNISLSSLQSSWQRSALLFGGLLALPLLGVMSAVAPSLGVLMVGGLGVLIVLVLSRSLILTVFLLSGTVDVVIRLGQGPISPLGFLTIAYGVAAWSLWLLRPRLTPDAAAIANPFVLFLIWGSASALFWSTPTISGIQNLLVIAAFLGLMLLSTRTSLEVPRFDQTLGPAIAVTTGMAAILFLALPLVTLTGLDLRMGNRSFALFAIFGVVWHVAGWRYGERTSFIFATTFSLLILASLSRMAFAVSLAAFPLSQLRLNSAGGWIRLVAWASLGAGLLWTAMNRVESLRSRFFEGDVSMQIGGLSINAAGRTNLWNATLQSFWESPWIGHGAGSAQALISGLYPGLGHPHNDYYRILHDYGVIGLGLFLLGYGRLLWSLGRAWHRADRRRAPEARMHAAAFITTLIVALTMYTDNVIVYIFIMAPLGVLVGCSLGLDGRRRDSAAPLRRSPYSPSLSARR